MSKVADLFYDIQELYIEGHSAKVIAIMLECPIEQVLTVLDDMGVQDELSEEYDPHNTLNS
jgi:hypothetical protein